MLLIRGKQRLFLPSIDVAFSQNSLMLGLAHAFLFFTLPTTYASTNTTIQNRCDFSVYVAAANCTYGSATNTSILLPNHTFTYELPPDHSNCGQTIKLANNTNLQEPYQIEWSTDLNGIIWYDLSAVDGNPFLGYRRFMQVASGNESCHSLLCLPGETACEWPAMHDCLDGDIAFTLC